MRTLFAITYSNTEIAKAAMDKLPELQKGSALSLVDAVLVTRNADGAIKLNQLVNTTAVGAASGALWGSLLGLVFLSPLLGAAVGATAGAIGGYATDYGISDEFMREMAQDRPEKSATLFVLAANMTADKVAQMLKPNGGEVIYTSMPDDIEERFKSRFRTGTTTEKSEIMAAAADLDA
jgi:uncharacterized membrane protein